MYQAHTIERQIAAEKLVNWGSSTSWTARPLLMKVLRTKDLLVYQTGTSAVA